MKEKFFLMLWVVQATFWMYYGIKDGSSNADSTLLALDAFWTTLSFFFIFLNLKWIFKNKH